MNLTVIRDSKAVCPKCSGMITSMIPGMFYQCIDCHAIFTVGRESESADNAAYIKEAAQEDVIKMFERRYLKVEDMYEKE